MFTRILTDLTDPAPQGGTPPFLIADCNEEPTVTSVPKKDFPWQNYF